MTVVTVPPTYQIVIPKDVREKLDIRPGQQMEILAFKNRIVLIPVHPPGKLRGTLNELDNDFTRDPDRL